MARIISEIAVQRSRQEAAQPAPPPAPVERQRREETDDSQVSDATSEMSPHDSLIGNLFFAYN